MSIDKSLFERIGGIEVIRKVHHIFYNKLFAHSWLKQYFVEHPQEIFENQQTDFMISIMGGPKRYAGLTPKAAHSNIVITDELFEIRSQILSESIKECGVADDIREEWLTADRSLKKAIVKTSAADCTTRRPDQRIYDIPKPQ
ncbi:MAG: group 1 truncated hemoglobin [Gammaproteobacteria bacterium]|nr:group 1 truncated hemoglobin [Gammaproteobacteria bacterium]MDH5729510.1 group 1 truncated hemoglobin [Gammaproteobacteria bacterium]